MRLTLGPASSWAVSVHLGFRLTWDPGEMLGFGLELVTPQIRMTDAWRSVGMDVLVSGGQVIPGDVAVSDPYLHEPTDAPVRGRLRNPARPVIETMRFDLVPPADRQGLLARIRRRLGFAARFAVFYALFTVIDFFGWQFRLYLRFVRIAAWAGGLVYFIETGTFDVLRYVLALELIAWLSRRLMARATPWLAGWGGGLRQPLSP